MKIHPKVHSIILLVLVSSTIAYAEPVETTEVALNYLPSSPISFNQSTHVTEKQPLSCKIDSHNSISSRSRMINVEKLFPELMKYLNDAVRTTYNTMRNGVIKHVTLEVAMSLFNFNVDGFAAENIAKFVSDGTKPFLPFKFANGVKITKVTPKGGTIIYRTEMPITKDHSLAVPLALAGKVSATTTVCNDMKMVDDLLGRNITIQYDYYDSNGVFFSSFTING